MRPIPHSIPRSLTPPAMEGQQQTAPPFFAAINSKTFSSKLVQLTVVLVLALALKYHYSTASVNELRWILAPTTSLIELISGSSFTFESHAGYMSADNTFLIAASCSGVNFMLVAFLMLTLGELWRKRSETLGWIFLPRSIAVAFATTIIANTVRIDVALQTLGVDIGWFDHEELHRLEGIFVYFGFLMLLFILVEMWQDRRRFGRMLSSLPLPLFIYYATTLGIPVVTGAYREPQFLEHSIYVVLIPLVVMLPLAAFYAVKRPKLGNSI